MKLLLLLVILCFSYSYSVPAAPVSEEFYRKSLAALQTPDLCTMKLICAIYQSDNEKLKSAPFMQGISLLANFKATQTNESLLLEQAVLAGNTGESCSDIAPACKHSAKELLLASLTMGVGDTEEEAEKRRLKKARLKRLQSNTLLTLVRKHKKKRLRRHSLPSPSSMPPLFRSDDMASEPMCQTCDERSAICAVFGVGSTVGCFITALASGPFGSIVCNTIFAPVRIACGSNSLHCYMEHCGVL